MKIIQVLGTGCPKCQQLYELAEKAATELGIEHRMEKIDKLADITAMGVMMTPALAIDGHVVSTGRIPPIDEIRGFLSGT